MPLRLIASLAATLSVVLLTANPASGQDEDYFDTIEVGYQSPLNYIELSDEGVVALDTAGEEWYYDFNHEAFLPGLPDEDVDQPEEYFADVEDDEVPVEERCTEPRDVIPFESWAVTIGYDEYVDGDITTLGRVTVKGWVKGNVTSFRRRVLVTSTGVVEGYIEAPEVIVKDGGEVWGEIKESDGFPMEISDITVPFSSEGIVVVIVFTLATLICGFLVTSLMPRQTANFYNCFVANKAKTFLLGLLFMVLMAPIMVLVIITIVGILVVPLIPIVYLVAFLFGVMSFGHLIGRRLIGRFLGEKRRIMLPSAVGVLVLTVPWLMTAALMGSSDSDAKAFGVFMAVVSSTLSLFPAACGVGCAILTRFGFREYLDWRHRPEGAAAPVAPAPPPIPDPPTANGFVDPNETFDETPGDAPRNRGEET